MFVQQVYVPMKRVLLFIFYVYALCGLLSALGEYRRTHWEVKGVFTADAGGKERWGEGAIKASSL